MRFWSIMMTNTPAHSMANARQSWHSMTPPGSRSLNPLSTTVSLLPRRESIWANHGYARGSFKPPRSLFYLTRRYKVCYWLRGYGGAVYLGRSPVYSGSPSPSMFSQSTTSHSAR